MADKADVALVLGVVGLVPAIYGAATPPLSLVHAETDERGHTAHGVTAATMTAAGIVLAVAVGLRSWPVAVYGLGMVAVYGCMYAMAWQARP